MTIDSIPYDELVYLLNFDDPAEFRKRLRAQDIQIPTGKPVARVKADEIAYRFTGHGLPWKELEEKRRTTMRAARLSKFSSPETSQLLERWYRKINPDLEFYKGETFLGIVCEGGFLEGTDEPEFIIGFNPGINIIIGERGSGKSTVLNLLGLLADSVGVETKGLVHKLLNIFYPEREDGEDEVTLITQRATETLNFYGVNQFASYYKVGKSIYCFYINFIDNCFDFFNRRPEGWTAIPSEQFIKPSILFFEQGEVIRIAEEREKNYYLNSIMDAIYPELYRKRTEITQKSRKLVSQHTYFKPNYLSFRSQLADRFINARYRELKRLLRDLDDNYFDPDYINIVQGYLDRYYRFTERYPTTHQTMSILTLLEEGEDALFYLYVGRIRWFLHDDLNNIRSLIGLGSESGSHPPGSSPALPSGSNDLAEIVILDPPPDPSSQEEVEALEELEKLGIEEDFATEFEVNPLVTDDHPEEATETPETVASEGEEESSEFARLLEEMEQARQRDKPKPMASWSEWSASYSAEDQAALFEFMQALEEKDPRTEELLETARHMADFLRTRLRILRRWIELFHNRHVIYDKAFYSLVDRYVTLLVERNSLISKQIAKCQEMTLILKQDESDIRVYTLDAEEALNKDQAKIESLSNLSRTYEWMVNATPKTSLRELRDQVGIYDQTIDLLFDDLDEFKARQIDPDAHTLIFNPIGIDLRQGNVYRNFHQLSFGQKSGIILKMVLSTTDKKIVMIDQPEDNLDAFSIVNMLSATLGRLGQERQVILVTHNSNLVIGLEDSHLAVLKSSGEKSRLHCSGSSQEISLLEEMINVLEGGKETFDRKLLSYERFINRVKGMIPDIDFAFIESSYRRRTIDGLSNYLQPIVSDRVTLAHVRHELKHLEAAKLRMEIRELRVQLSVDEDVDESRKNILLEQLDKLARTLDSHIARFLGTIEEIRMMDTNPKPEYIDLYGLLLKLQAEYTGRLNEGKRYPEFHLDDKLKEKFVWADQNHLRLIFRNLIENALRATERRKLDEILARKPKPITETIRIQLDTCAEDYMRLIFNDNGCGMPLEIKTKIYKERCSDQRGSDHGLGAVVISKLLGMNFGSVEVLESHTSGPNTGTVQQITLSMRERRV
jgi:signal transduction histidine kinase